MRHGTLSGYKQHRCRCEHCAGASSRYGRTRRALLATGEWDGLVPADKAREQIAAWMAQGITIQEIVRASDCSRQVIRGVHRGSLPKIQGISSVAILAATPQQTPSSRVSAIGIRRRVQGLMLLGWTGPRIAAEYGVKPRVMEQWMTADRCYLRVLQRVDAATERLARQTPPETQWARTNITRAKKLGWIPLAAWDDIDDPTATPVGIPTGQPRSTVISDPERIQQVHALRRQGLTDQEIADRLGYRTASAVQKIRNRHKDAA